MDINDVGAALMGIGAMMILLSVIGYIYVDRYVQDMGEPEDVTYFKEEETLTVAAIPVYYRPSQLEIEEKERADAEERERVQSVPRTTFEKVVHQITNPLFRFRH